MGGLGSGPDKYLLFHASKSSTYATSHIDFSQSPANSLRRNVNIGITSRRDPLNNEITNCRDTRYYVRRKISGLRRDVI